MQATRTGPGQDIYPSPYILKERIMRGDLCSAANCATCNIGRDDRTPKSTTSIECRMMSCCSSTTTLSDDSGKPRLNVKKIDIDEGDVNGSLFGEPLAGKGVKQHTTELHTSRFSSIYAEAAFCLAICMTQFLAEYLITGFAIELPHILARLGGNSGGNNTGLFWPACLLTLILSAFLLVFARVADKFGGYLPFMAGVLWLGIWTLVAGFASDLLWMDICRANHGLAIAIFTPATFTMVSKIYDDGRRKNIILGLYAGSAPVGFFAGFLVACLLPGRQTEWYFWFAAMIALVAAALTYITVPAESTGSTNGDLQMDWPGSFFITAGLLLVSYALAVVPYADSVAVSPFASPQVVGPLVSGLSCLAIAVWVEGWVATSPLLPMAFFRARETKILALTCLFFYASYGVWLYDSALFLQSGFATSPSGGIQGVQLALWYAPTAIGGVALCVCGGALLHVVSPKILLCVSGVAWVAAPLLLAVCPLPVRYWAFVMPSMLCATVGIDLTFTISIVCLTRAQPAHFQGLAGAVCSILVNLAISFSLPISQIIADEFGPAASLLSRAAVTTNAADTMSHGAFRAAFFYAAASAGVGLLLSLLYAMLPSAQVEGCCEHGTVELLVHADEKDWMSISSSSPVSPRVEMVEKEMAKLRHPQLSYQPAGPRRL